MKRKASGSALKAGAVRTNVGRIIGRGAGPDARTRVVQPRRSGWDAATRLHDGEFDFDVPAGLDIQSEISAPEIGTAQRAASAAVGLLLTSYGLKKRTPVSLLTAAFGAGMIIQGATGMRIQLSARRWFGTHKPLVPIKIHESFTIYRTREEVYSIWRSLENLPHYMRHLADVERLDSSRSKWTFELPGLLTHLQWIAELTVEDENRRLAWRSQPGGDIATAGDIRFEDAPGGKGTILRVRLAYWPPAGKAGRGLSRVFNPAFERLVREDLRRVKYFIEAEEIPTTEGQPVGPR